MSNRLLDELAQSARNRGLKLVRSRVRTPGRRRYGKVGLTDARGKPVLGMDAKGPTGTPDEVEDYLRNLGAKDWGASIDVAVLPRRKKRKPTHQSPEERQPAARPPRPAPKPQLREAKPSDAPRLVELIRYLGHEIDEKAVRKNLAALKEADEMPLVAVEDKRIVGLVGIHKMVTIHRSAPVGRIPALVVAQEAQGRGIGKMLLNAAEQWCRKGGCQIVEVTSNDRRTEAHAFYRHMGYERTSIRFFKKL
jgi:GNAT superfamily N-acetyltransferase